MNIAFVGNNAQQQDDTKVVGYFFDGVCYGSALHTGASEESTTVYN
ncbi:TPA: hypothetical protein ACIAR9_003823 [Salmonella enterica subsp. enterica serovar Poona]|nr:hypothetical protein [Salmonella enterica]EFP4586928.1 hypothetical protein [Salmonella enterica]EFP4636887.1 hypothetical protein [Salmonella enterica]EFS0366120.1 hypothetical protein [Salmonella enterica]EGK1507657.1 hypothetical protein [Salmonella enterica]HAK5293904.1 hypothetical protein [Salmonella enterica]